jgi:hypothetical protein
MKLLCAAVLFASFALASSQSIYKMQFIFFRSNDGKTIYHPAKQISISEKTEIAKLIKFLPGLGYGKGGLKPGGWDGWGTVRLMRTKGSGIQVFFPGDGAVYSVIGKQGDFPAGKGFRDYLLDIEKKAK